MSFILHKKRILQFKKCSISADSGISSDHQIGENERYSAACRFWMCNGRNIVTFWNCTGAESNISSVLENSQIQYYETRAFPPFIHNFYHCCVPCTCIIESHLVAPRRSWTAQLSSARNCPHLPLPLLLSPSTSPCYRPLSVFQATHTQNTYTLTRNMWSVRTLWYSYLNR